MHFKTHIDLINLQDEETNYLYSDIMNKSIDECETKEEKIRREILDAYTSTMCRFFRISELIMPVNITEDDWAVEDNNPELGTKIATSVFKINSLNMLYSLDKLNWFNMSNLESDYVPDFDHIAKRRKKASQKDRNLTTKKFYKEVQDGIIGYIEMADFNKYCDRHSKTDGSEKDEQLGMSRIFHFANGYKKEILSTTFEFIGSTSHQVNYNLNMNMAKMYSDMSLTFQDFLNKIVILKNEHFAMREGIKNGYYDNGLKKDDSTREEAIKTTNLNILLFSSLYNFVDYLLYMLHLLSNRAYNTSKHIQLKYLYEKKEGNVGMLNYDEDKINGILSKEDFDRLMGKRTDFDDEDGEEPEC